MSIDRSKFRATSLKKVVKLEEKAKESSPQNGGGSGFPPYLKIPDGKTRVRILPENPNSPEDISCYFQQCSVHWLPYVKVEDDGKKKEGNRPVFNARIHGSQKKDIIDEYISRVVAIVRDRTSSKEEMKRQLNPINGYRATDGKWVSGISVSNSWEMYVLSLDSDNESEIHQLSLRASLRNKINEAASDEVDEDDAMGVDPFTDIEEGLPLTIKRDSSKKGGDGWGASIHRREEPYPLGDDVLESFLGYPSLEERYVGIYNKSHFDRAIEGLELFDQRNDFEVFDSEEFQDLIVELGDLVPEKEEEDQTSEKEEKKAAPKTTKSKPKEKEVEEGEPTDLADMNKRQMKQYIKDNDYSIRVLPRHTEDDLQDMIEDYEADLKSSEAEPKEVEEESSSDEEISVDEGESMDVEDRPRRSFRDRNGRAPRTGASRRRRD